MPESLRWRDGRLWVCNWLAQEVVSVGLADGDVVVEGRSPVPIPFCIDWLPDGRLLMTAGRRVLVRESRERWVTYADLDAVIGRGVLNEIVTTSRGWAYVNGGGYDMMAGDEPAPGGIWLARPDGSVESVAEGIEFGNGMAITGDESTLLVAESHAARITAFAIGSDGRLADRRVFAELGERAAPDGLSLETDGSCWYADVPNQHCVRVAEGGERLAVVELDRGAFDCALAPGGTLFVAVMQWDGGRGVSSTESTGQVVAVDPSRMASESP